MSLYNDQFWIQLKKLNCRLKNYAENNSQLQCRLADVSE